MFLHLIINIFLVSKLFALQQFINKNLDTKFTYI